MPPNHKTHWKTRVIKKYDIAIKKNTYIIVIEASPEINPNIHDV